MRSILLFSLLIASPALALSVKPGPMPVATAQLADTKGHPVGSLELLRMTKGLLATIQVEGLAPGPHGLHFHQKGSCDDGAAGFKAAGSHAAHEGEAHGVLSAKAHFGDLPNLYVGADGTGKADFFLPESVKDLADKDGSAIMIHAKGDDYKTEPSGNSGDRIACGVLTFNQ